ncbi:hypothetical protein ABTY98_21745 [Streptomyces sp. NPDC096040]|uniref:hypothetical protein n=1 Tax=Streptomyces sp. NPDC096040 TaxID=3155541 RepID=UPI003318C964
MTTRHGNRGPRLALVAGRSPAVHFRYRLRLKVDAHGWIAARSADDRHGFIDTYAPGSVVEIDLGMGSLLTDYDAVLIAEAVSRCSEVYLISSAACGEPPHVEGGCAHNPDGVLVLMRQAIEDAAAADRGTPAC